jgi:hypothetical protein
MRRIVQLAAGLSLATSALANDSAASIAAGGLVLQRNDSIDLLSEDLYVSADEIRVRYVFRNRTRKDVETIVAFPMPDRDLSIDMMDAFGDFKWPSDFRTRVAGRPVQTRLERKAVLKGKDYTALLKRLRIPLEDPYRALKALSAAGKSRLRTLGLARDDMPLWTVKETYFWTQRFPAGRDLIIDHRYVPGAGGSVQSVVSTKEGRSTPEGRAMIARYCMDRHFLASVDALPGAGDTSIDYVLTTGANWARPIGDFRLVVDKARPDNLVSFCGQDVRKISPTQFEVRRKNWRPTRDLHVLIIRPYPQR